MTDPHSGRAGSGRSPRSPVEVRVLGAGDEAALLRFLEASPDSTLFLRANLREAGIVDSGGLLEGTYAAAFAGADICAVGALYWNGNLVVEGDVGLEEVVGCLVHAGTREVRGFLGRYELAVRARAAAGLADRAFQLESEEALFALDLRALRVPEALASGSVRCRVPRDSELDELADWRVAYSVEALGDTADAALRQRAADEIRVTQRKQRQWVLETGGAVVAYTAFNAVLPDCVQVGGVFTPPELRGRGYARCAVAGSLLAARERGVARSVLFTELSNTPAQAAYRALGYEPVGTYGILLA